MRLFFLLLVSLSMTAASFSATAELKIQHAWVKNAPPVTPVRAAYLTLENNSDTVLNIVKITSPQFAMVDAHETTLKAGVYSMKPLGQLSLAPHQSLNFVPKGKHLMLMMPTQPLGGLSHIQLNFHTQNGKIIHINAAIKN